jgi:hypothetical protein
MVPTSTGMRGRLRLPQCSHSNLVPFLRANLPERTGMAGAENPARITCTSGENPHIMRPEFLRAKIKASAAPEQTNLPAHGEIKQRIQVLQCVSFRHAMSS